MEEARYSRMSRFVVGGGLALGGLTGGLLDALAVVRGGAVDAGDLDALATPLSAELADVAWIGVVCLLAAAVWLHFCRRFFPSRERSRSCPVPADELGAARLALADAARGTVADRMFFTGLLMYALGLAVYMLGRGALALFGG